MICERYLNLFDCIGAGTFYFRRDGDHVTKCLRVFIGRALQVISYLYLTVVIKVVDDIADSMNLGILEFRNNAAAVKIVSWTIMTILAGSSSDDLFCFKPIGPTIVFAIECGAGSSCRLPRIRREVGSGCVFRC